MTRSKKTSAQVSTNGRVTIPKRTRKELGIEKYDTVILEVTPVGDDGGDA